MKHKFTTQECKKGGWIRARQVANIRRANPTPLEKEAREFAAEKLFHVGNIEFEFEFWNDLVGFPQFFDIYFPQDRIAIEVDGSKGWHDHLKMKRYDSAKVNYCDRNDILIYSYSKKGLKVMNKYEHL